MRPTGFGVKQMSQATADYNYPLRKADGTILDFTYKTLTEQRRELLYLAKLGYTIDNNLLKVGSTNANRSPSIGRSQQSATGGANMPVYNRSKTRNKQYSPEKTTMFSLDQQQQANNSQVSHISAQTLSNKNIKEIIGKKFSKFSKEDRFNYVKIQ